MRAAVVGDAGGALIFKGEGPCILAHTDRTTTRRRAGTPALAVAEVAGAFFVGGEAGIAPGPLPLAFLWLCYHRETQITTVIAVTHRTPSHRFAA